MDYTQITYDTADRVACVSLNRPEYRNPIGRITVEELDNAFERAVADSDVGVILLRAEGQHFSAGHDLGTPAKIRDDEERPYRPGGRGQFERSWEIYIDPGLRWRNLPKPTIAAVQGYCIWGGWMVATAMDIVFATEDARFLGSKFQYFSVPWDIGIRKAKEVLFEARFISGREAQQLGFVGRVFATKEELDDETLAYAKRVAQQDEFALRMTKYAINQAQDAQGYSNTIVTAHNMQAGGGSGGNGARSQGYSLPSGERRVAPVQRALDNLEAATGLLP